MEELKKAKEAVEDGKLKAEKDLTDLQDALPGMQERLELKVRIHYARQVNEIKGKVYQEGYNIALDKL